MRTSNAAKQRAHVEKARADAIARADKKAKEKAEAEAEAKAKEDKPKLSFLCNIRGCNTKDVDKQVISDHWSVDCAHGKKNHGPFCNHCGNHIRENDPCLTYGDDHCPRKKHITNPAKLRKNDGYALQRQLREEEKERKARNRK